MNQIPAVNPSVAIVVRARRGQTLIVALAVLFILLFIGGLFVARVARNLTASARSRDTSGAQALAEAGVKYCSDALEGSEDGADWRPTPTNPVNNSVADPDYYWLQKGFARVNLPGGRALVRVSYDPHPDDPRGQFLKIESIGRPGDVGNGSDPTVFVTDGTSPRLRRELIAYKQIGLTDYLRFFTDKDRRGVANSIGTPAIGHDVATVYGNPQLAASNANPNYSKGISTQTSPTGDVLVGAPIKSNSDLNIVGDTYIYEGPRGVGGDTQAAAPFPVVTDRIEVAGQINVQPTRDINADAGIGGDDATAFINSRIDLANPINPILPSNSVNAGGTPNFLTYQGLIRDGSANPDAAGYTRNVPYTPAPRMDSFVTGSGVLRYRALTRDSGFNFKLNGQDYNTGRYGFGTGIYVDNTDDLQQETTKPGINGSYSLRSDWLNPNAQYAQGYWEGPYYRPPGVLVELLGDRIRLTRNDGKSFHNPDGSINPANNGQVLEVPLTNAERNGPTAPTFNVPGLGSIKMQELPHDGDTAANSTILNGNAATKEIRGDQYSYGVSVVIMAEGNVRVKGVYGAITDTAVTAENAATGQYKLGRVHLTLVTGGTAYIEGNLVKGDGFKQGSNVTMERQSTCAILARDYVCVNTTMFMQPQNQTNVWSRADSGQDAFYTTLGTSRLSTDMSFSYGVPPSSYTIAGQPAAHFLFMRHSALAPGPALINLQFNPGFQGLLPGGPLYPFNYALDTVNVLPDAYVVGKQPSFNLQTGQIINGPLLDSETQLTPGFEGRAFTLGNATNAVMGQFEIQMPGYDNLLRWTIDQTTGVAGGPGAGLLRSAGTTDYLLGGASVAPMDIRIEALLYAQDKSFFVIPGYQFNPDPSDTEANAIRRANAYNGGAGLKDSTGTLIPVRSSYTAQEIAAIPNLDLANPTTPLALVIVSKAVFPYHDAPQDVRITLFGAIAENYSASIADQAAWMVRWGYIPAVQGSSAVPVPYDHLTAHDARLTGGNINVTYMPGDDSTLDNRSPRESGGASPLSHGMRFQYDPAFAMPYGRPTDVRLNDNNNGFGASDTKIIERKRRALRFKDYAFSAGNTSLTLRQVLPPIPRLPVCPGLVYSGDSDHPIGSEPGETDAM